MTGDEAARGRSHAAPTARPAAAAAAHPVLLPVAAVVAGILSIAVGTSLSKGLFPRVGAEGTTALRVGFATLLLLAAWRPWRRALTRQDAAAVALYGLALGTMNLVFYLALRTIPFGIAVAIEFAGPLCVAALSSRRALDLVWIGLAVVGLGLLLPLGGASRGLDPAGLAFAAAAGIGWALYIVFGQRAGRLRGPDSVALGSAIAAVLVIPVGVAKAGTALLAPATLMAGLGVALLSSAVPYSLEMYALQRLPRQTFGVLLSIEPAVAALAGMAFLGESLVPLQWLAIGCVVAASIGSAASA